MEVEVNPSQIIKDSRQNNKENNIVYSSKPHPPKRRVFKRSLRTRPQRQGQGQSQRPMQRNPRPQLRRRPLRKIRPINTNAEVNMRRRERTNRSQGNTRLLIRNLTKRATNEDLRGMFEKAGPLKRCGINWNDIGESKGTADVEYLYEKDARSALKRFDYKLIKGVPIRIEMRNAQGQLIRNSNNNYRQLDNTRPRRYSNENRDDYYRSNRSRSSNQYRSSRNPNRNRNRNRSRDDDNGRRRYHQNNGYSGRRRYRNYNDFN